ncbi:hypothetical protein ALC57_06484 [Trachymyrmex cornetzi]|uniref:Uncharacterized protein n=1 Tax=Trachymyrmex cornetzi TaxID=471704 RepID=A0A151J8N1_9HYME|nr:hypothetical protein ALC57_06484 [Trachymyrmex cornetzi]
MIAIYTECKVPARSQFVKLSCCSVTFAGLVAHIIYRRKKTEEEKVKRRRRTKPKAETEREREQEKVKEEERRIDCCFLGLRRAYCVILATVAAATAGIIIISKGGQNTGPESHNAEFYDFWHRGDATGCNAAFYALLTAPDLISRPEMNGFSKRLSDRRWIRLSDSPSLNSNTKVSTQEDTKRDKNLRAVSVMKPVAVTRRLVLIRMPDSMPATDKRAVQHYNVTKQCRRWPGISTSRYSDVDIYIKGTFTSRRTGSESSDPHPRPVKSPNHSRARSSLNELLSVNAAAECCKLSRCPKTVHRHATREIIVLSRDLAAMNEGVHGSHLPSSLPLYKLHDDVTWFNLNT